MIIAAALITWVSPDPRNPIVTFLHQVTEPVLAPGPPAVAAVEDRRARPLAADRLFAIQLVEWGLPRLLFQAQH